MTPVVREQLNTFQQLFGKAFWKKTIIEITFWSHDRRSKRIRGKSGRDEKLVQKNWDTVLRTDMGVTYDVPVVFIDPVIEDGFADEKEIEIFLSETQKVKNFTSFGDPYVCNPHVCMTTSFTAGLPTLQDSDIDSTKYGKNLLIIMKRFSLIFICNIARRHSKMIFKWKIWFADDCGEFVNLRNYEIRKDKQVIYTLEEYKIEKAGFRKNVKVTDKIPQNIRIEDECAKMTVSGECDIRSKWKIVVLTFYNIEEDSFGIYTVKNSIGESKPISLVETIDGKWNSWSSWSSCSKTCLR